MNAERHYKVRENVRKVFGAPERKQETNELLAFAEKVARSACLDQRSGYPDYRCICFSCEANRIITNEVIDEN